MPLSAHGPESELVVDRHAAAAVVAAQATIYSVEIDVYIGEEMGVRESVISKRIIALCHVPTECKEFSDHNK